MSDWHDTSTVEKMRCSSTKSIFGMSSYFTYLRIYQALNLTQKFLGFLQKFLILEDSQILLMQNMTHSPTIMKCFESIKWQFVQNYRFIINGKLCCIQIYIFNIEREQKLQMLWRKFYRIVWILLEFHNAPYASIDCVSIHVSWIQELFHYIDMNYANFHGHTYNR